MVCGLLCVICDVGVCVVSCVCMGSGVWDLDCELWCMESICGLQCVRGVWSMVRVGWYGLWGIFGL